MPGFGQLLNGKYIKGILLVSLELFINVMGNFNTIIILSFNFKIEEAIGEANYTWLMFYPCLYFFSIWDAYKDAGAGKDKPFAYLPLVSSAYFVTTGLIFSSELTFSGYFDWADMAAYVILADWFRYRDNLKTDIVENIFKGNNLNMHSLDGRTYSRCVKYSLKIEYLHINPLIIE